MRPRQPAFIKSPDDPIGSQDRESLVNVKVLYKLVSAKHKEGITISINLKIKYGDRGAEYLYGAFRHTLKAFMW